MTINIIPGMAIQPSEKSEVLSDLVRVLHVHNEQVTVIKINPQHSQSKVNGQIKTRHYFSAPFTIDLNKVKDEIQNHNLVVHRNGVTPRPDVLASDEELDRKYLRPGQSISSPRQKRHARYELIKPLVEIIEDQVLLFDHQVRNEKIAGLANQLDKKSITFERQKKEISETLNQFFAGGGCIGALTPFCASQGGRGKEREQKSKLGRTNIATKNNIENHEGFIMTKEAKDICGYCWRNFYVRNKTIKKAYRKMLREFFSEITIDAKGNSHFKLKSINERPSLSQFIFWGQKRSPGDESWKKQFSQLNLNRLGRPLFGNSNDDVISIGQRGAIDSTSIDVELVSVASRLERIGSAHRILLVDCLYNFIPGFYLGLEAASANTVGLTFLHAMTDKTEWLKWLGLEDQDPENWIPMRFGTVLADNTDARSEENFKKVHSIGTGLKFVNVARSDLNSSVETTHHILHRMVDHNLYGTTHGKRHERGDVHATVLARHTPIEAIRETARAIYLHNTIELDIVPTLEMRRELVDKGIKLTRANLTRWKINQGKCHTSLLSEDEARIKLMVPIKGTFTQHGVKLLRSDTGEKRVFVEPIRYISNHPLIVEKVLQAKVQRARVSAESHDDFFLHNPYQPTQIFYKNILNGELIKLTAVSKDVDLLHECSLPDIIHLMKDNALYSFRIQESRAQAISDMEAAQEQTKDEANKAYAEAISTLKKPPSKSSLKRNKTENRKKEKDLMLYGMPIQGPNFIENYENHSASQANSAITSSTQITANEPMNIEQMPIAPPRANNVLLDAILRRRG
jgi:hypothetical protein